MVDNLTWFSKVLINIALILVAAVAVMVLSPLVTVALTYWESVVLTGIARILPSIW